MTTLSLDARVVAGDDVVSREIENDTVLLSMTRTEYYGLNPTGTRIWQLLQEPRTLRDVSERIAEEFDATVAEIEADVISLTQNLLAHGLVRLVPEDDSRG